jgi:hypothetical protein
VFFFFFFFFPFLWSDASYYIRKHKKPYQDPLIIIKSGTIYRERDRRDSLYLSIMYMIYIAILKKKELYLLGIA